MRKLKLAILAATLAGAMSANASYVNGTFTVGEGNSWNISWLDTTAGVQINGLQAVIVGGGATFDGAVSVGQPESWGWNGVLLSSTVTYAWGTANGVDRHITLSFADPKPTAGVVVNIFELFDGNVLAGQAWQWMDLPGTESWQLISANDFVPVPEPTTMIAGALLLLPFGASTLRILRKRQTA